jgi:hypothetical protein
MSPLLLQESRNANHTLQTLKQSLLTQSLNVDALKSFLTKRHGNAGRERYRRASLTAFASFISKALTMAISFVSVPLTVHYLGAVAMALSKIFTSSPIQSYKIRGILRANRAPALVHEQLAVA